MDRLLLAFSRAWMPVLVTSLLVLTGCGKNNADNNGSGGSCTTRADCASGERCNADGTCTTSSASCEFGSDCGLDEYCAAGSCELAACAEDSDCVEGAVCDEESCRPGCRSNDDCESGETCSAANICIASGCTTDSCPPFQACDQDAEPAACVYTGDCDSDAQCVAYGRQVDDGEEYICSNAEQRCVAKPPCGDDSDCSIGDICEARSSDGKMVCRRGCRDNDGCRTGQICDTNNLVCTEGCDSVDDCPNDGNEYVCFDLVCVVTCETRNECAMGQVCTGSPRVCQACADDNECPATEICDKTQGTNDADAADPDLGLCVPKPPTCPDDGFGDNHDQNTPHVIDAVPFETDDAMAPQFCRENQAGEWFQVTAESGDVIEVELTYSNDAGNLDVALRRAGGEEIVAAEAPPSGPTGDMGTELLRFGVDLSGTFLIHVRGTITADNIEYGLRVDVAPAPACADDALEPNDSANPAVLPEATDHLGLQVCGDDPDFYTLSVSQNQVIKVTAYAPIALGNIDLILRDSGGVQVGSAVTGMSQEVIEVAVDDAGDYELEVRVASGVGNVDYDLEWNQRDNNCADQFEVNDTCPGDTIAPGTYDALNVCDDSDWYSVDLLPLQTLTVTATYDRAISAGDLDVTLFGPNDCATLVSPGTETPVGMTSVVEETVQYQAQQGGTFNIQIFLFSGVQAEYDLEIDVSDGPPCVDDAYEPNDDSASAVLIDAAQAATGADNVITGLRMCDMDEDWYRIDLAEGDEIRWEVQFDNDRGDLDAEIIGPGDVVVDIGDTTTDDEIVEYTVGAGEAGAYYLKVTSKFAARNDYWVLTYLNGTGPVDPDCPDELENNDDAATAAPVSAGSYSLLVCGGAKKDDDWFTLDLNAGETLQVDLAFEHANGNIDLTLFDDTGITQLAQSRSTTDNESISFTAAQDQTVIWRVEAISSQEAMPYGMTVAVTPAGSCQDDVFGGNNDSAAAAADVESPNLYGRMRLCNGTEDWYAFDLTGGRASEVFINFDGSRADLDLEVYDPALSSVGTGTTTTSDESVIFTPAMSGTYYAQVTGKNNARLDYDLLLYTDVDGDGTMEGPEDRTCPDPYEDNDTAITAAQIPAGSYDDLLICAPGDNDYYEVFVPADATLTVTVNFDNDLGNIDLRLLDENNNLIDESRTTDDVETVTSTNGNQGTSWKIHVFGAGGTFSNYYQMDVDMMFADMCSDDAVGGDPKATAGSVSSDAYELNLCEGSEDWFDLGSVTSVDARLEFKNQLGDLDIELHDSNGVVMASTGTENTEELAAGGLSGQHWLRVFAKNDAFVRNAYDMWLSLNGTAPAAPYCPDRFERNDDLQSAATIQAPTTVQVADLNACGADQDWYTTGQLSTTEYQLAAFYDHGSGADLTVKVWHQDDDPTTVSPLLEVDTAADDAIGSFTPATFGPHTILVENTAGTAGATPYDLLLGRPTMYTSACPEDSSEPNDSVVTAATVAVPSVGAYGACGDDDYFKFTAPSSGSITITAVFDASKINLGLQVQDLDNNLATVGFADDDTGNRESVTFNATAGNDYVVSVLRGLIGGSQESGPYFLRIE